MDDGIIYQQRRPEGIANITTADYQPGADIDSNSRSDGSFIDLLYVDVKVSQPTASPKAMSTLSQMPRYLLRDTSGHSSRMSYKKHSLGRG